MKVTCRCGPWGNRMSVKFKAKELHTDHTEAAIIVQYKSELRTGPNDLLIPKINNKYYLHLVQTRDAGERTALIL